MRKQGFVLASVILMATVFITKVLGIIYRIPLTHILGGMGMAYFSSSHSVFMPVYAISVSGIPPAVAKLTAGYCAVGNYRDARKLRQVAHSFFLIVGLSFTAFLILFSGPVCTHVIGEPGSRLSVAAIAPCVVIGALTAVERGYCEGMQNMLPTAVSEIIEAVMKLALGLLLAQLTAMKAQADFEQGSAVFGTLCQTYEEARSVALPYIAAASTLGVTLSNLFGLIYIKLHSRLSGDGISKELLIKAQTDKRRRYLLRELLALAVPFAVASVISTISGLIDLMTINRCLDRAAEASPEYFSERFGGISETLADGERLSSFIYGSYSGLALTVFGIVPSLTAMLGRSILPLVSSSFATSDKKKLSQSVRAVVVLSLFAAIPCGLGISVFSEEILLFLFSGRTDEIMVSQRALSVLGLATIPLAVTTPLFSVFQALGRQFSPIGITLLGCFVKLIMNLLLVSIPQLNIVGAGISTLICYIVMAAVSLILLRRDCGKGHISNRQTTSIFLSAILCIEGAYLLYSVLSNCLSMRISFVVSVLFSVNIYIYSLDILSVLPKSRLKSYFSR